MKSSRSFKTIAKSCSDKGKWISKYFIVQSALTKKVFSAPLKKKKSNSPNKKVQHQIIPEISVSQGEISLFLQQDITVVYNKKIPTHESDSCLSSWVGFTVSKKVGNAPQRNRVKRKLRALLQNNLSDLLYDGVAYVFIARSSAVDATSVDIEKELRWALNRLHKTFYPDMVQQNRPL